MDKLRAPTSMRDFYPEDMRLRRWIEGHWAAASQAAGFQEWDGPIMELTEVYTRKSGPEIVSQLYQVTARESKDQLAVRPEMTPSLARMVAARQGALPLPVKWFCMARMCRSERGQRGRLREFRQWNLDILGAADPVADAEVIAVGIDALERCGLAAGDFVVRLNARPLTLAHLAALGVPEEAVSEAMGAIDRRGKVPDDVSAAKLAEAGVPAGAVARLFALLDVPAGPEARAALAESLPADGEAADRCRAALAELDAVMAAVEALGRPGYLRFDPGVVRGLAYYTGVVFEFQAVGGIQRAIAGGGRYDKLIETFGGKPMPAVGLGMGDVVLEELLKDKERLPVLSAGLDCYAVALDAERRADLLGVVAALRAAGWAVDHAARPGKLGAAMKRADELGAKQVAFVGGDEWARGMVKLRDMAGGSEAEHPVAALRSLPRPA